MSTENACRFVQHAAKNEALQYRIGALKGRNALQDLCAIAAEEGFHFSEEEYRAAVVSLAEGELDDDAIQAVQRELGIGEG